MRTGECYNLSHTHTHTHSLQSHITHACYIITAFMQLSRLQDALFSATAHSMNTSLQVKVTYPCPVRRLESKVSTFGTVVGIFGSLWAEVVPTIQNPLNATTVTARGLWDRTILLSKGIRAHTTWPLFSPCVCVCVCAANDQITLYCPSPPGFTETVRTAEIETSNGQ